MRLYSLKKTFVYVLEQSCLNKCILDILIFVLNFTMFVTYFFVL